jgi:hypothetical protein
MAYADLTYYKTTYVGRSVVDAETTKWLERASDDLDMMTGFQIVEADLSPWQLTQVKKACCAQAEFYVTNGETYNADAVQSASIGKFSYSGGSSGSSRPTLSPRAMNYLSATGLMFAGVSVAGAKYAD